MLTNKRAAATAFGVVAFALAWGALAVACGVGATDRGFLGALGGLGACLAAAVALGRAP